MKNRANEIILLSPVWKRIRELGIRLALGTTSTDILRQFLIEAVILASIIFVI